MLRFRTLERPASPEEAYAIIQKRKRARILGGGAWMRLAKTAYPLVIDLSACGLDAIEDAGDTWRVGAMVSLRALECHEGIAAATGGAVARALAGIVGVQFRAGATVGGSVAGRFGFSDVCCVLLALGAEVELVGAGRVPIDELLRAKAFPRDVLTHVHIPKGRPRTGYCAVRRAATDIPVLNAAASATEDGTWRIAVGARPARARLIAIEPAQVPSLADALAVWADPASDEAARVEAEEAAATAIAEPLGAFVYADNMWASAAYRRRVAPVIAARALRAAEEGRA